MPALNLDFASFSFQVPVKASSAKQTAAAARHITRAAKIALNFMYFLLEGNKVGPDCGGFYLRASQLATKTPRSARQERGDHNGTQIVIRCFDSERMLRC